MLAAAIAFAFFCVGAALLISAWRVFAGPDLPDRILALDTLYVSALAALVVLGIAWSTPLYFEAALLIALLGFVATAALARYAARGQVIE